MIVETELEFVPPYWPKPTEEGLKHEAWAQYIEDRLKQYIEGSLNSDKHDAYMRGATVRITIKYIVPWPEETHENPL